MQGGQHEVPGEGRLHGDLRGFAVADFAHHDHVRVLAQDGAQAGGEGHARPDVELYLPDAVNAVFDGIFKRDGVHVRLVEKLEDGIEACALAAPVGPVDRIMP